MNVLLDTSVLVCANEADDYGLLTNCMEVMKRVLRAHVLVLDHEERISTEYMKKAIQPNTFAFWWWDQCLYARRTFRVSSNISAADKQYADAHHCDADDYMFLAAAKVSAAPIVHEDSDYEAAAVGHLGVHGMRSNVALNVLYG